MKNPSIFKLIILTIGAATALLLTRCSTEEVIVCGIENPCGIDEDLTWLDSEVKNQGELYNKYFYVSQAVYQGEIVFLFENCCPLCQTIILVKNCSGDTIGHLGYNEGDIDPEEISNSFVVWKAPENECVFIN